MNSKNLDYNIFEGNIFSLNDNQKIKGMHYGLDSISICKLLKDTRYNPEDIRNSIDQINFLEYSI